MRNRGRLVTMRDVRLRWERSDAVPLFGENAMMRLLRAVVLLLVSTSLVSGQSVLDGTSYQASLYNLADTVGAVRLIDGEGSNCRVDDTPVGDDKPSSDDCISIDSGIAPVTLTFNAGPQAIGNTEVTSQVQSFAGLPSNESIVAVNEVTELEATLDWSRPGDLLQFTLRTADGSFPAEDDNDFWGFSAENITYPNAVEGSEVVLPYDDEIGNYTNFFFWFENEDGPILTGYEVALPEALGVGRHPLDPNREVVYPLYSPRQADEQTDTVGGVLDFYSHGSILNSAPEIGNALVLFDNTTNESVGDAFDVFTGVGFGLLVLPPDTETTGLLGDFDGDGSLTANDIDLLSAQVGNGDLAFDLNADSQVNGDDRDVWVGLAQTLLGDTDLDGTVAFPDFLSLSASFGNPGGWADGDTDGSGDIAFPDFLALSANFGQSFEAAGAVESVPEPHGVLMGFLAVLSLGTLRRRR